MDGEQDRKDCQVEVVGDKQGLEGVYIRPANQQEIKKGQTRPLPVSDTQEDLSTA